MGNPYDLIVFDWEGTIADTLGEVFEVVAHEASELGLGQLDIAQARAYVDLGLARALQKIFPQLDLNEHERLLQAVQRAMHTRPPSVCLIPGAREVIQQLHDKGINIAIATNKGHQSLMRALQTSGLDKYFKVTRSAGQAPAKPCPQMLEEIIAEFGGAVATTLMIGDSISDMEMAKSIHVNAIGVDFYHQQSTALKEAGALAVFDEYKYIARFLHLPES